MVSEALKLHEDKVVEVLEKLTKLEQLIALRHLPRMLNWRGTHQDLDYWIAKESKQELGVKGAIW